VPFISGNKSFLKKLINAHIFLEEYGVSKRNIITAEITEERAIT
jgi:hypothetical protein